MPRMSVAVFSFEVDFESRSPTPCVRPWRSHISVEVCLQAFTCQTEVQHLFLIGGKGSVYKTCSVVKFKRLTLDMEVIALLVMGNLFTI